RLCRAEGPEQRLVLCVAGDLPVATYKTGNDAGLESSHCNLLRSNGHADDTSQVAYLKDLLSRRPTCGSFISSKGLYENYLSMRVRDPNLQAVCEALDWLTFSDRLNQVILHGQNFSLMKYLPFLSVAFHFLFAHPHVPRISYPHSHHEVPASSHLLSSRNALSTMLADIPASIRSRIGQLSLTLDILTLLLDIICPKLRPVNPQLFSSREKDQMRELIDTMLAYNLSYRQDRTPEGQYTYVLEPRVEDVARFSGLLPRRQLTYQAKQTISREMEQEKMRRAEQMMLQRNPVAVRCQSSFNQNKPGTVLNSICDVLHRKRKK
ncbi:hypothetical protein XENOCAPTIV_002139, partial [Xenoophorus captivus]